LIGGEPGHDHAKGSSPLALAAALLVTSAYAAALPPLEYDHPYKGHLDVVVAENAEQIRIGCRKTGGGSLRLACALRYEDHCTIVRRPEADLLRAGFTLEVVMRHEIGHCNGWPQDHAGARWGEVQEVKVQAPTPKPRPSTPATRALAVSRHDQRVAGVDHARGFNPLCFPAALVTTVMSLGTLTVFCN